MTLEIAEPAGNSHDGAADDTEFRRDLIEMIPFLRAFARVLCGRRDGADDLCQEALTRAWRNRASFEPGTNLKAWLFRILRNQFYSDKRRAWRQLSWDDAAFENHLTTGATQESAVALSEVVRALHLLPSEQREALILVAVGGFPYEEAARICNCAVGTIKSRVARARQELGAAVVSEEPLDSGVRLSSAQALSSISAQLRDLVQPA